MSRTTASGTTDPRTSTTLILFEEFVPYEYRQQLASPGGNRRRLPSLFSSTNKSKQWKPASTLNGRPYVVGAVPHSPSYREVEFEGLLRSNGSKVLSLHRSPDKDHPNPPSAVATPGHELQANPLIKVTTPTAKPPSAAKPQFLTPVRTDSPTPTPKMPASPLESGKKSSRFRLPTGLPSSPSPVKRAGLAPTEYDPVDFDTRIASFDDEEPSKRKHNRRRSKDDAWVDILVANTNRRMPGQDAQLRNGLKGGRSDPELASQEVSEVLAAVRARFSDEEEDGMEPVAGPSGGETSTLQDSVLDHDQHDSDSLQLGDDEEDESLKTTPKKRPGYFDLHPDRRPPTITDDPRDRLERPSYESDTSTNNPYTAATVRPRNLVVRDNADLLRQSAASEYESDPEPVHIGSQAIPRDVTKTLPSAPENATLLRNKSAASKTANLIEMYRERERQSQTSPIPSSRLPVRQASLQNGRERSISPLPATPSPAAATPVDLPEIEEPADDKVSVEDIPIDLPTRYIHGAPLHNVLEEPEEEEA